MRKSFEQNMSPKWYKDCSYNPELQKKHALDRSWIVAWAAKEQSSVYKDVKHEQSSNCVLPIIERKREGRREGASHNLNLLSTNLKDQHCS
jgi:hypothetical protein